jgi:L-ascorbate metabolism protein UlaG (beta-lactamase superfamily)
MATVAVSIPPKPASAPEDAGLRAHHNSKGKGFINPWDSFQDRNLWEFVKWAWFGQRKPVDTTPPTVAVHTPEFLPSRETVQLRATWLGHACFYVEFPGGLRVLFDPVFTQRCSPLTFLGPKRYTEIPCQIEEIPFIDAVIISHNHYDHMSHPTLTKIKEIHKSCHFFVPLGNKPWYDREGFQNVTELDWWDQREISIKLPVAAVTPGETAIEATISCLPCQHTSARTGFDKAHTLWASWGVESGGKKVWFGGDTGYRTVPKIEKGEDDYSGQHSQLPHCPAFKQIGDLRGPFDLGLIPIGAYEPRYLMSPVHANPYDSVNIFADTRCKRALGIHWGTWVLTDEEVLEPPRMLKHALKWKGLAEDDLFETIEIGVSKEYP